MLRAGAVKHPDEWKTCGYHELANSIVPGRDSLWTESTAVGDLEWIESLAHSHVIWRKEVVGMRKEG